MKCSDKLIEKIKEFEGFSSAPYKCAGGVYTIGYGHTKGVRATSPKITREEGERLLRQDLAIVEKEVNALKAAKTQGQFDALVDFAFNLGLNALLYSTLLKRIREDAPMADIQREFRRWVYANNVKLKGLVIRRDWEAKRFAE